MAAFTNLFAGGSKPTEEHQQLDTPSSTPPAGNSGISTPRPDPTDRRFPSILSSYFSQVGPLQLASTTPQPTMPHDQAQAQVQAHSPALSDSISLDNVHASTLTWTPETEESSGILAPIPRSPPKTRSVRASSNPYKELLDPEDLVAHEWDFVRPTETRYQFQYPRLPSPSELPLHVAFRAFTSSTLDRHLSVFEQEFAPPLAPPRRIIQAPPSPPPSPRPPRGPASSTGSDMSLLDRFSNSLRTALSSSSSSAKYIYPKLTNSSRDKQTPPRTPRSLSNDSKPSNASASSEPAPTSQPSQTQAPPKDRHTSSTDAAVVGFAKGKLSLSITEGRGLRPSVEPYLVCQFQYNEYISKGPRNENSGTHEVSSTSENLGKTVAMQRTDSNSGRAMAIPMKSRQSSQTSMSSRDVSRPREVTDPVWNHECVFDVVGDHNEVVISVYDHSPQETFLGHVRFCPTLIETEAPFDQWLKLLPRSNAEDQHVTGEIRLSLSFQKIEKKHFGPDDFQALKLIGKGTFGQVFQVRKKDTQRVYAMKVLSKKIIVQKKEVAHTVGERNILVRTAMTDSPFIVGLKFSFQTPTDLYLVTDYMSGGELFWHLQRESRFHEDRAKFYIAELILALQLLHQHDIVYRDLKPENILLDATGHIALCDFGLSKANLTKDDTTNTFCGTTEYLAPEVLLDEHGYTKMVDFWSLGVLVFEMVCGWSPFYAEDTQQMYKNIAFGKVRFPRDALSLEGRNFVKGLLNRNPKHRLGANGDAEELKAHAFFNDIDWDQLAKKNVIPPFKPQLKSETDTSNFDPEFTNAVNGVSSLNARAAAAASGALSATTPLSPSMQANFKGFTFVDESALDKQFGDSDENMETSVDELEGWDAGPLKEQSSASDKMTGIQNGNVADEGMFGRADL